MSYNLYMIIKPWNLSDDILEKLDPITLHKRRMKIRDQDSEQMKFKGSILLPVYLLK